MAVVNKVIISIIRNKLVCKLLDSINVEETVVLRAIFKIGRIDHLTSLVEFVYSNRKQAVGTSYSVTTSDSYTATINIIIICAFSYKTSSKGHSILKISGHSIAHKNASLVSIVFSDKNTFVGEFVEFGRIVTFFNNTNSFMSITLAIKRVCFSTDHRPYHICISVTRTTTIVVGAIAKSSTVFINYPSTFCDTIIAEIICDLIYGSLSDCKFVVGIRVAILTNINSLPSFEQVSGD